MNVEFYNVIKEVARTTVNESKPVALCYGTVDSASPLKIRLSQKLILTEPFLVVSENLTDYEYDALIDGKSHRIKMFKHLKAGEKVLLIRMDSGQKYYVAERVE